MATRKDGTTYAHLARAPPNLRERAWTRRTSAAQAQRKRSGGAVEAQRKRSGGAPEAHRRRTGGALEAHRRDADHTWLKAS